MMCKKLGAVAACFAVALAMSCCFSGSAFAASKHFDASDASRGDYVAGPSVADGKFIGKKLARKISFADAGVKKKACKSITVELRPKGGRKVYLVGFTFKKKLRYHYTLNARDGEILAYYTKCV